VNSDSGAQSFPSLFSTADVVGLEWDRGHASINALIVSFDALGGLVGIELRDGNPAGMFWLCSDEVTDMYLLEDDSLDRQIVKICGHDSNLNEVKHSQGSFRLLLERNVGSLIAFYQRRYGSNELLCGYLEGVTDSQVTYFNVDPSGVCDDEPESFAIRDLAMVEVGTPYLRSLRVIADAARIAKDS
jgi:hypothetical protein